MITTINEMKEFELFKKFKKQYESETKRPIRSKQKINEITSNSIAILDIEIDGLVRIKKRFKCIDENDAYTQIADYLNEEGLDPSQNDFNILTYNNQDLSVTKLYRYMA